MEDREWMYTLRRDEHDYDLLFIVKVEEFLQHAFGPGAGGHSLVWCPCNKCDNRRKVDKKTMGRHLVFNGYMPSY